MHFGGINMEEQRRMKGKRDPKPDGWVLIAANLPLRNDYSEPKRYKIYKIINDELKKNNQASTINPKTESSKNLLEDVLFHDGDGYLPVYEYDNKGELLDEANTMFRRNKIDFALISVDSETHLLQEIISKGIPFSIVSPDRKDVKCEWLHMTNDKDTKKKRAGIFCKNYKSMNKCEEHDNLYNNTRIKANLKKLGTKISHVMEECHIKKIPVFQYSTSLDIIRWYHFFRKYSKYMPMPPSEGEDSNPLTKDNDRQLALIENFARALRTI
jgi:hypothetical protein